MTTESTSVQTEPLTASYRIVIDALDWGPSVVTTVLALSEPIRVEDICSFTVTETGAYGQENVREVTDIYLCDEAGIRTDGDSAYLAIEMRPIPCGAGSYFVFSMETYRNEVNEDYSLSFVTDADPGDPLYQLDVQGISSGTDIPDIELFETDVFAMEDLALNYGLYRPVTEGSHPLIIWLHGQGEGGDDVRVALLGNRVTAFAESEVQDAMNGAYVLIPQCPTYWPEAEAGNGTFGTSPDGSSAYLSILKGLIDQTIVDHPDIDPNRILIGGCSMGGYMTTSMLLAYPDFFAAGFPVCAYYPSTLIDDEELPTLSSTPLWYINCESDQTVPVKTNSGAIIDRLQEIGVEVHSSSFPYVADLTGKYFDENGDPFFYNPHWVWIHVYNGDCNEGSLTLWDFLADARLS